MKSFACGLLVLFCLVALAADGPVVINEIHHSPDPRQERVEFIELFNRGATNVDLTGWRIETAVNYSFPSNTILPSGGYLVVAEDPVALKAKFGTAGALGPWVGTLNGDGYKSGDQVVLRDATATKVDEVDYQVGFPWPLVGRAPGYSMELIHPKLDNSLGGNWRASAVGQPSQQTKTLVPAGSTWRYRKGTAEASSPTTAWRKLAFDDFSWALGPLPIGYDPAVGFGTKLDDMRNTYRQVFLRKQFIVTEAASVTSLRLSALFDDGFKLWLNGKPLLDVNLPAGEVPFDANSINGAREDNSYVGFDLPLSPGLLREGNNVLAVQFANVDISASSDAFFDGELVSTAGPSGRGPTPGRLNAVFATNAPPALRQVTHTPQQPMTGEAVTISVQATDPDGMALMALEYQLVEPGHYIGLADAEFATGWTRLAMTPTTLDTNVFAVTLPATLSKHRNLIRYRLIARDALGAEVQAPYADDPTPNFAVFCYDGVPAWTGATHPGVAGTIGQPFTVSTNEMNRLAVFQLISKSNSVAVATGWAPGQPNNQYRGDDYLWQGTLVYDGEVYDHIRYRMRGGVWRYTMGKNAWKFDFNPGHDLKMRDDYGKRFNAPWDKLSFRPDIQQGDYDHRGEQGLFESVGYRLFQLAAVDANKWTHVQFRIIDEPLEAKPSDQFGGDFWGKYLAVEEQDGQFLKERSLPDGNIYDMEGGTGTANHFGKLGPLDKSDLNAFLNTYNNTTPTEVWWRTNLNLPSYYGYQAIAQGIHQYDIADGKNYFYYRNPEDGRWVVQPWDLDLTWADNMYRAGTTGGDEPFKSKVLANFSTTAPRYPGLSLEFRNRVREIRDLLFNADQAGAVIDEQARLIRGTNNFSIVDADRAQWDFNPVMTNSAITLGSKAGWGRFYQFPQETGITRTFAGGPQLMKNYATKRSALLDSISTEPNRPSTPTITSTGPANFPLNRIAFHASAFAGTTNFATVKWRVAEISRPGHPSFHAEEPMRFEIEPTWETTELTNAVTDITVPVNFLRPGLLYRARVRYTDAAGRTSNWSPAVEFTATEPDTTTALVENLRLTELMYNPPTNGYEFIELANESGSQTLDLNGVKFTAGVDFTFPANSTLAPSSYAVIVKTTNYPAFRAYHGLAADFPLYGPYGGSLDNGGETVTLKTGAGAVLLFTCTYSDLPPWPAEADGQGFSLVPRETGPANPGDPLHWRSSTLPGGSPGRADPQAAAFEFVDYATLPDALQVKFSTGPTITYTFEVSPNLIQWTPVATNTGPTLYNLKFIPGQPAQFIRAIRQ